MSTKICEGYRWLFEANFPNHEPFTHYITKLDGALKSELETLQLVTKFSYNDDKILAPLFQILSECIDGKKAILGEGKLSLNDLLSEKLVLKEMWPLSINFGELCCPPCNDEENEIEITWKFKGCEKIEG